MISAIWPMMYDYRERIFRRNEFMTFSDQYRSLLDAYQAAVARGDAKGIGSLFTEDAVFLAPDQDALHGSAEVVADYAASLGDGYEVTMHIEHMQDCGTFSFGSGVFEYEGLDSSLKCDG
jgi:ketosteroid isomerase-like protein